MSADALQESGRRYRSKKQRPCDVCRSRKIQCKLHGTEVVCDNCKKLGRRCTYVLGPLTRKHRGSSADGGNDTHTNLGPPPSRPAQHDALMVAEGAQINHSDSQIAMDVDPFWLGSDMQWSPRGSSDLLALDWPALQGSLGMVYLMSTQASILELTMSQVQA